MSNILRIFIRELLFLLVIGSFVPAGCNRSKESNNLTNQSFAELLSNAKNENRVLFAKGFEVMTGPDFRLITLKSSVQAGIEERYYLISSNPRYQNFENDRVLVLSEPIRSMVCTSTTHIPLLEYLGKLDVLKGFPGTHFISSEKARKMVSSGQVQELGNELELNAEVLLAMNPDLIMTYTYKGEDEQYDRLRKVGIPIVYNLEFLEDHPLGRAEWLKFMAAFVGEEEKADSIFNAIVTRYNAVSDQVSELSGPTIMSGIVYGDSWFMPGGKNHMATLFRDAGGSYVFQDDSSTGSLQLGFEFVYEQCHDVEFWIGVSDFKTRSELQSSDIRYGQFRAFSEGNVFNYNNRTNQSGGNDYFEQGYLRPDIVIKDLAEILHPGIFEDYELYFYRKLE